MKTAMGILALVILLVSAGAQANCRAADAAKVGADAGLARDQAAAMATADNEKTNSDVLGKCISGITSIIVVPTFPSLMSIFDAALTKMCKMASDAIPRVPNFNLAAGIPVIPGGIVPAPGQVSVPVNISPAATIPAASSDFWSKIWR